MQRGTKTHEQFGTLGTIREVGDGWQAHCLPTYGPGALPTFLKGPLWPVSPSSRFSPPPTQSVPSALPTWPRQDDNPAVKSPIHLDKGAAPGLSSTALADTSGPHLSSAQNSPLGPKQPVRMLGKSMLGNSHKEPASI